MYTILRNIFCTAAVRGPPRWLAGTFFLLQMRRGVTLYDGEERQLWESRLGLYSPQLSWLLKQRCLLHDVPPQTFIRPPKTVTFHTIVVLLTGGRFLFLHSRIIRELFLHTSHRWMVVHSGVHGFISRLSRDKENRVPDKCSWCAVDRHGARCHGSSLRWKVRYHSYFHLLWSKVCLFFFIHVAGGPYVFILFQDT